MDSSKDTPFPPASEVPVHRNAPLAPTQELAYRKKCVQLKRRLAEIEANNDSTRKRIMQETEHVQKMRLMRAILLNHLQEIMSAPAKRLTPEQLEKIGVLANGHANLAELAGSGITLEPPHTRPEGEGLLDDSSEESDEDEPEPLERPERRRRANNNYRETIMNTTVPGEPISNMYQQSSLPNLAPANSFSPAPPHDPTTLTSSFRVSSATPQAAGTPSFQPPSGGEPHYGDSSPISSNQQLAMPQYQSPYQVPAGMAANNVDGNGTGRSGAVTHRPQRPEPPYMQFTAHMRPQLEAHQEPEELIPDMIQAEWDGLAPENRRLWEVRYQEQMTEYTAAMDAYKRATRREASGGFPTVNS
ncbi:hypothetical protein LTR99_008089 [Exophiala xenobiotica]|uniref:HMG box domain-containing protein n=1 Tax=Vermiconidia calcicola TaxID=1690605 RepID=A0AAV9QGB1_9PEZI|nr:hypothetical protein LTR92_003647 [Exophiala xenobiotica]KAK5543409.1 hypothetical protein LTR25_001022 [Vermiconidia calcicola]KAK5544294.1 hypothetical protein LTR23_004673 [Chaetothyriales sp. CCFEE 6169]KAK5266092.1 hypothetical protein LTR96_008486 [Exophiala xenobiotica]KAK5297687.1 hypothetical protein LTR99_008089 [Exophiala xenobiotica]